MNIQKSQSGTGIVEILLIFVVVGIIGFTGWFVWQSQHSVTDTLSKTDISSSPTVVTANNQTTDTTQPSASETSQDGYLVIKEWGIRYGFRNAAKVTYSSPVVCGDSKDECVNLSLKAGTYNNAACKNLGISITRSSISEERTVSPKKAGQYYFYVTGSPQVCTSDKADEALRETILTSQFSDPEVYPTQ